MARELAAPDRFVVVRDGRRHSYAQAGNEGGRLVLEYRHDSPQRHFRADGVGLGEVAEVLSQWADGERAFVDRHTWTRLTEWDPPGDGAATQE